MDCQTRHGPSPLIQEFLVSLFLKLPMPSLNKVFFTALITALSFGSFAQESTIRKNITERIPQLKAIDEVNKTPIPEDSFFDTSRDLTTIFSKLA